MATDSFTATSDPLPAPWTGVSGYGSLQALNGEATPSAFGTPARMYYAGAASGNDQYVQAKVTNANGNSAFVSELGIRMDGAGTQGYYLSYGASTNPVSLRRIGQAFAVDTLGGATTPSVGDVLRLEGSGNTFRAYLNGVQFGGDVTDSTFPTGGQPWIGGSFSTYDNFDDFDGGDLGGGGGGSRFLLVRN